MSDINSIVKLYSLQPDAYLGSTVYGEISWNSIEHRLVPHLLKHKLIPDATNVWLDFGSGIGNICYCLSSLGYQVRGVENDEIRYNLSQKLKTHLQESKLGSDEMSRIKLYHNDFFLLPQDHESFQNVNIVFGYDVWMNRNPKMQRLYAEKLQALSSVQIVISGLNRNKDFVHLMQEYNFQLHSSLELISEDNVFQKFNIFVRVKS